MQRARLVEGSELGLESKRNPLKSGSRGTTGTLRLMKQTGSQGEDLVGPLAIPCCFACVLGYLQSKNAHRGHYQSEPCFACLLQDNMKEAHRQPQQTGRPKVYVCTHIYIYIYIREHTHEKKERKLTIENWRRKLGNARAPIPTSSLLFFSEGLLLSLLADVCGRPIRATTPYNIVI